MRVAVVTGEYPTRRAPERAMFVRDQVEALRGSGHQVCVIHHEPPTLRRLANRVRGRLGRPAGHAAAPAQPESALPESALPDSAQSASTGARWRILGRLAHDGVGRTLATATMMRDLRRLDPAPEVVHAHNVFPAGVAAVRYAARAQTHVPVVVTEHSSAFLRGQLAAGEVRTAARVYRAAARVVAVSPRQAEAIPATDVEVVPNVLPADFTLRAPDAAVRGDIVSIGTLMPHKGMETLVRAYAALPAHLRERHRLVLVGDGPQASRLTTTARELGVHERVVLTGHLRRSDVAGVLRGAALLVSASPVETFGMTLIEGLASGVPFVAVRSGGPESVWFTGAGVLVAHSTPEDLGAGIRQALGDDESGTSAQVGSSDAERRTQVQRRFGADEVAARLSAIYRAAVAARDGRRER